MALAFGLHASWVFADVALVEFHVIYRVYQAVDNVRRQNANPPQTHVQPLPLVDGEGSWNSRQIA